MRDLLKWYLKCLEKNLNNTTLHYTVLNHTSLHYTTWPCTSLDCTVSCAHNRCGRPGRGEAGYWNTLPPLGTALDRRGLSQLDYLGHCPLAWHCSTGVHPPYYLELAPRRERCYIMNPPESSRIVIKSLELS